MALLPFRPKWGKFKHKMAVALYWMRKERRAQFELTRINVGYLYSQSANINGSGTVI